MTAALQKLSAFYSSSIGRKMVVAVTGIILLLFLAGHMAGNLLIFAGPDALNAYAQKLKNLGPLLWLIRLGLLATFALHITATIQLVRQNRTARGSDGYAFRDSVQATIASRTMIASGLIILAFVIYHILQFTVGAVDPAYLEFDDSKGRHDVYRMVVTGFRSWPVTGFYILAMGVLCMHLSHGFASVFQTLGLRTEKNWPAIVRTGQAYALLIFIGNSSIPLSILGGWVTLEGSEIGNQISGIGYQVSEISLSGEARTAKGGWTEND